MILLIEPICRNIGMYVPAYPLPLMEIASFVKANRPQTEIEIVSFPMDYGLPLTRSGKEKVYAEFLRDLAQLRPRAVGISCTAIAQAQEVIHLSELIKTSDSNILVFLGGYFPSLYHEEIFARTWAVDLIVTGEGEFPTLQIVECLSRGRDPVEEGIPNIVWKRDGKILKAKSRLPFDLSRKALLDLGLLRYPRAYDILPYAFSRGCPYRCNFCMEDFMRPIRKEVPVDIIRSDLESLACQSRAHTLLISDALFKSFDRFPLIRKLGMKVNFETRSDLLAPSIVREIADICGALALGFESASYATLRRMNKVKDRSHYDKYMANTREIFNEAVRNEIPIMVFMIAGYPGDTEEDLEQSLRFARELSRNGGEGGHIFKIGECRAYPKTKIYEAALSSTEVTFDNDGVFGENIVRQPSKNLDFETVLKYMREIFELSNTTPKVTNTLLNMMPFFRLPAQALRDEMIPGACFAGPHREIFNVRGESLSIFRDLVPRLSLKYKDGMSDQRARRHLQL